MNWLYRKEKIPNQDEIKDGHTGKSRVPAPLNVQTVINPSCLIVLVRIAVTMRVVQYLFPKRRNPGKMNQWGNFIGTEYTG
jgi:hypothetical protein